jgi:hypothetical protein
MTQRTIDTHTHILTEETAALLNKGAPKFGVSITRNAILGGHAEELLPGVSA